MRRGQEPCRHIGSQQQQGGWLWTHPGGRPSLELQQMKEAAFVIRWRGRIPSWLHPWRSGKQFLCSQGTASRHTRSCKVLQAHQQELPMFHPGGLPLPRLSVCLGISRATCWVRRCYKKKKTHQYMTCIRARHAELCAGNLCSAANFMMNIFMN